MGNDVSTSIGYGTAAPSISQGEGETPMTIAPSPTPEAPHTRTPLVSGVIVPACCSGRRCQNWDSCVSRLLQCFSVSLVSPPCLEGMVPEPTSFPRPAIPHRLADSALAEILHAQLSFAPLLRILSAALRLANLSPQHSQRPHHVSLRATNPEPGPVCLVGPPSPTPCRRSAALRRQLLGGGRAHRSYRG